MAKERAAAVQDDEATQRRQALEVALSTIEKQFGKGSITTLSEARSMDIKSIPTGALSLDLAHFEDSEFYDKLTRARMEASSRPLGLVMRSFGLLQNLLSLGSYAALLWTFSGWAPKISTLAHSSGGWGLSLMACRSRTGRRRVR